ncbi:hypothetical protein CONLIGDRAFT_644073 [Coniochaeta ligniaria NRRL 30616]|uniref:Uncharacterized protein n=1 Tax=Coniochaeta ligniaria NRRL 30616 TaxID=1408157 RepID=A0A1J7ISA4_9PEZI|nr:hypothetical protein CONLIGDRAFT_644073 [Coniochaeta ligniaria NRRL 30616]
MAMLSADQNWPQERGGGSQGTEQEVKSYKPQPQPTSHAYEAVRLFCLGCSRRWVEGAVSGGRTCRPRPTQQALLRNKRATDCPQDACLDALLASVQPGCTRLGAVDCASYFKTTITPNVSTVQESETRTVTTTIDAIAYKIVETSLETNKPPSQTTTTTSTGTIPRRIGVPYTLTESVTVTQTATETQACPFPIPLASHIQHQTVTTTNQPLKRGLPPKRHPLRRRDGPNKIPGYASECPGADSYSSACSCLGVTDVGSIVYAGRTPTSTVTVSATYTATTETKSATLTTSVTSTSTMTLPNVRVSVLPERGPFIMYAAFESVQGPSNDINPMLVQGTFVTLDFGGTVVEGARPAAALAYGTRERSGAARFFIDLEGYLRPYAAPYDDAYVVYVDDELAYGRLYVRARQDAYQAGVNWALLKCVLSLGTNDLVCGQGNSHGYNFMTECNGIVGLGHIANNPGGGTECDLVGIAGFDADDDGGFRYVTVSTSATLAAQTVTQTTVVTVQNFG